MSHHRVALIVVAVAVVLDAGLGLAFASVQHIPVWHGLYCALANAVTVGGDVTPANPAAYAVTAAECALVVPLFAATFSLFTSGLAAIHIRSIHERLDKMPAVPAASVPAHRFDKLSEDMAGLADAVRVTAGQPVTLVWTNDATQTPEFIAWLRKNIRAKGAG